MRVERQATLFQKLSAAILAVVTAIYAYGALVHVFNMLGLAGFDWLAAPLKWQVLDVVYLAINLMVCVGLFRRVRLSVYAFYIAAFTQIGLYTVLRSWIVDVPEAFKLTSEKVSDLSSLVVFHAICLLLVSTALTFRRSKAHEDLIDTESTVEAE